MHRQKQFKITYYELLFLYCVFINCRCCCRCCFGCRLHQVSQSHISQKPNWFLSFFLALFRSFYEICYLNGGRIYVSVDFPRLWRHSNVNANKKRKCDIHIGNNWSHRDSESFEETGIKAEKKRRAKNSFLIWTAMTAHSNLSTQQMCIIVRPRIMLLFVFVR